MCTDLAVQFRLVRAEFMQQWLCAGYEANRVLSDAHTRNIFISRLKNLWCKRFDRDPRSG